MYYKMTNLMCMKEYFGWNIHTFNISYFLGLQTTFRKSARTFGSSELYTNTSNIEHRDEMIDEIKL